MVDQLFHFEGAVRHDPTVDRWFDDQVGQLGTIARYWFDEMRNCGDDVCELLHDGHPTACVSGTAFGYVNAFSMHVNVGFFRGAELDDPDALLVGTGRYMRHVKLRPGAMPDEDALRRLVLTAYDDMKRRIDAN